ncbi:hypothetical protein Csa_010666 [Cucumis sativus]|uniref:Uncharacterized protein n=1 Tax=Cucumis sativus TaxID=3659 RepID=A0A0A0L964_CUCSA|nr:hypothetical protein Csa_010666 [Cucumis sativus]
MTNQLHPNLGLRVVYGLSKRSKLHVVLSRRHVVSVSASFQKPTLRRANKRKAPKPESGS